MPSHTVVIQEGRVCAEKQGASLSRAHQAQLAGSGHRTLASSDGQGRAWMYLLHLDGLYLERAKGLVKDDCTSHFRGLDKNTSIVVVCK